MPTKHGEAGRLSKTVEYALWLGIKKRCYNPLCKSFPRYGGRGIYMHQPWINSYETFLANILEEIGRRPIGYTLDRKDNDGHYEPHNIRWADKITQAGNSSTAKLITYGGETKPISVWARDLGMTQSALSQRLLKGWNIEDALEAPVRKDGLTSKVLTYKGETKTAAEWADLLGVARTSLYARIYMGWPDERVIEQPFRESRR